jgi:hypothetical protein
MKHHRTTSLFKKFSIPDARATRTDLSARSDSKNSSTLLFKNFPTLAVKRTAPLAVQEFVDPLPKNFPTPAVRGPALLAKTFRPPPLQDLHFLLSKNSTTPPFKNFWTSADKAPAVFAAQEFTDPAVQKLPVPRRCRICTPHRPRIFHVLPPLRSWA